MCNCEPVLQPDDKLKRMITLARILLLIHLISSFSRIFMNDAGSLLSDFLCCLFLFIATTTIFFMYMAIYIFFCLLNTFYLFLQIGFVIQRSIQGLEYSSKVILQLCFTIYLFVFYIFAIVIAFPIYKEMRAQMIGLGTAYRNMNQEDRERPNASSNANANVQRQSESAPTGQNRAGFAAFQGRGVQVG